LRALGTLASLIALGCGGLAPAVAPAAPAQHGDVGSAAGSDLAPLVFIEDDIGAATARARAEGKALFVDAWAPWCHTCLSMQSYVLGDPSLRPLASRLVFASIDTDRPSSAKFLESHAVNVWPMFFVLDPADGRVAGAWPGSASLAELRSFIADSLAALDASRAGTLAPGDPVRLIAEARAAQAGGEPGRAALLFESAAGKLGPEHPRRSEVLAGWLLALYAAKDWKRCAGVGEEHLNEVRGAAIPADFSAFLLACAERLPAAEQPPVRAAAVARLRAFTAAPPPEASADDRADAWNTLAEALAAAGDEDGARRAFEAKIAILVKAAEAAPTPQIAATFDYGRASTYVTLGRGGHAIALLEQRERQMPGSYEPPARLASVLVKLGRHAEAKLAIERAIAKAYGPRRLGYLKLRGDIEAKLGDRAAQLATLREEVRGHESLDKGQASPARLDDARKRLAAAAAAKASP